MESRLKLRVLAFDVVRMQGKGNMPSHRETDTLSLHVTVHSTETESDVFLTQLTDLMN